MFDKGRMSYWVAVAVCATLFPVSAQAEQNQNLVDDAYECAQAIEIGEAAKQTYYFDSKIAWEYFNHLVASGVGSESAAKAEITKFWEDYQADYGQDALLDYALDAADECDEAYFDIPFVDQQKVSTAAPSNDAPRPLTAADLRYHVQQTGDYAAVADYVVGKYPYGKKLMEEIEEGNLLGDLVVETGANGVKKFSDDAVFALANQYYWQYNPPATRIIFAEYQRRLRVRKYNEAEGRRWAERAAQERQDAARNAARPSTGSSSSTRARKGSCTYVTDYANGGTKAICNQY